IPQHQRRKMTWRGRKFCFGISWVEGRKGFASRTRRRNRRVGSMFGVVRLLLVTVLIVIERWLHPYRSLIDLYTNYYYTPSYRESTVDIQAPSQQGSSTTTFCGSSRDIFCRSCALYQSS